MGLHDREPRVFVEDVLLLGLCCFQFDFCGWCGLGVVLVYYDSWVGGVGWDFNVYPWFCYFF